MILVSVLNPWAVIASVLTALGMIYIRMCLASCSRDLKRLESSTRTPVFSYVSSSIQGLNVIRSFNAQDMCSTNFLSYLDVNTCVNYLLFTVNRWAAFRFDWITTAFIACVTYLAVIMRVTQNQLSPVEIALTLSYSLQLMGLVQWCIRYKHYRHNKLGFLNNTLCYRLSVETEIQMTASERILEYCCLPQERYTSLSTGFSQRDWPTEGRIIFDNVSISHSENRQSTPTLRNISLEISPSEKIGIIGRTGAGKSTLVQSLFRMNYIVNGKILIDGINVSTIGLTTLRQNMSIIPQDPVLFTDTVRANIDPFGRYSDETIWQALEEVSRSYS